MNVRELKLFLNQFPNDMDIMILQNNGKCIDNIEFKVHKVRMVHEHMGDGMFVEWFDINPNGRPTLLLKSMSKLGFVKMKQNTPGQ